jgi:hypothetical protein
VGRLDGHLMIPFRKCSTEQLQEALTDAREMAKRCEEQGSFLHTWTRRADSIEAVLAARRRRERAA